MIKRTAGGEPTVMDLVTFDELKAFLALGGVEGDYTDLSWIKDSVVGLFEDYTQRTFASDDYTEEQYFGDYKIAMIPLRAVPVASVTSVLIDDVETTDYKITGYGIKLGYTVSDVNVKVIYTGGLTSVPNMLNRAALMQTVFEYRNKASIGQPTYITDGGSIVRETGMLKEVELLLKSVVHPLSLI